MTDSQLDYFTDLEAIVTLALAEDIGDGDITAQLIPVDQTATAVVITRESAIVCGRPWFDEVFRQLDSSVQIEWLTGEGQQVEPNEELVKLAGNTRSLLTGERTALNFLQTLMGTATTANTYAKLVEGTNTKVLDTRKTLPGLRRAQKYAVKIGGCDNHRLGLYDAFLIKENHIAACGSIKAAVKNASGLSPGKLVEIEVESIEELQQALTSNADIIMLDNFDREMMAEAIKLKTGTAKYEVSGNVDAEKLKRLPKNAIDYISSGALTKHCTSIDLTMRADPN